jgi:hypothetical protein
MKSIVASAMEFMITETNPFGASRIGPFKRHRSISSAIFAMVLWPAARVAQYLIKLSFGAARGKHFGKIDQRTLPRQPKQTSELIDNHVILGDPDTVELALILSGVCRGSFDRVLSAQLEAQRPSQN